LLPTYLEETARLFAEEPGLGLVFCKTLGAERTDSRRSEPVPRSCNSLLDACQMRAATPSAFVLGRREAYSLFCRGNFVGTATGTTTPKAVWDAVGGYDESGELRTSNDLDFMFKVILSYDVGYIAKPLAIYYCHDQNISLANVRRVFKDYHHLDKLKVLRRQLLRPLTASDRAALNERIAGCLLELAYAYRENRDYCKSLAACAESLAYRTQARALTGLLKVPVALLRDHLRDRGWVPRGTDPRIRSVPPQ
jgi:hypothetical protein